LGWFFEMSTQWNFIPTPPRSTADIIEDLPREFTVVVEEGNFTTVRDHRHELRMTFDISPDPSLDAYDKQKREQSTWGGYRSMGERADIFLC